MSLKNASKITSRILNVFPSRPSFCFAYGSGVKQQDGYDEKKLRNTLIDLVICVDDAKKWHEENLRANPNHYSILRACGPGVIARIQQEYGAKIYCNTMIPLPGIGPSMKYGVISTVDLINDLNDWTHLYVAGRLHKPIEVIQPSDNEKLRLAIDQNYKNALRTALLILPALFTRFDLFYTIANLSYAGDFRMIFGENKEKVKNIVQPQINEFFELYTPHFEAFSKCLDVGSVSTVIHQEKSPVYLRQHLKLLPKSVIDQLLLEDFIQNRDDGLTQLARQPYLRPLVLKAVANIVRRSSITQTLKNIPTAGVVKAIKYGWQKALKTFS